MPAKIRFNGYNANDAKKLAALDIQTKNILNPYAFVIAIKEYLEWNVDLPF
jgi:isocitrate/isopropylmalate dehydrogenase